MKNKKTRELLNNPILKIFFLIHFIENTNRVSVTKNRINDNGLIIKIFEILRKYRIALLYNMVKYFQKEL